MHLSNCVFAEDRLMTCASSGRTSALLQKLCGSRLQKLCGSRLQKLCGSRLCSVYDCTMINAMESLSISKRRGLCRTCNAATPVTRLCSE